MSDGAAIDANGDATGGATGDAIGDATARSSVACGLVASTHWSLLLLGRAGGGIGWDHFYRRYRGAVAALYRRRGVAPDDIDDLVHDFFATSIERRLLERADPARGRFRGYLRVAADRFLISKRRSASGKAANPPGTIRDLDTDPQAAGLADLQTLSPQEAFDLAWARGVLEAAEAKVRARLAANGAEKQLDAFRMHSVEGRTFVQIASVLSTTAEAARKWHDRIAVKLASAVADIVRDTLDQHEDLEDELEQLACILSRSSA